LPSFEAFRRFVESANPFAFWANAAQMVWLPWLAAANAVLPPGVTLPQVGLEVRSDAADGPAAARASEAKAAEDARRVAEAKVAEEARRAAEAKAIEKTRRVPDATVPKGCTPGRRMRNSGDCGQAFQLIADTDSDRSRTAFR
jgi:hypothetical protein